MNVTDLSVVKAEKAARCEFCGGLEHDGVYACPRIKSIKYDEDEGTVEIRFLPLEED